MALGTLRAINSLLGAALSFRRRRPVNLCEHCDAWVQLSGKSSDALARADSPEVTPREQECMAEEEKGEDSEDGTPRGQPGGG